MSTQITPSQSGVTRQAFYKHDSDALFRRLAIEQFAVQFVRETREKDPGIGLDKLWLMYTRSFSNEYRVGRDAFRSIMHERGLALKRRRRAPARRIPVTATPPLLRTARAKRKTPPLPTSQWLPTPVRLRQAP